MRSVVKGTGFVVGEHRVPNSRFEKIMDTSDEWIRERSGIEDRREGLGASGVYACHTALAQPARDVEQAPILEPEPCPRLLPPGESGSDVRAKGGVAAGQR